MIKRIMIFAVLGTMIIACGDGGSGDINFDNRKDSVSYALGYNVGRNIKSQITEINEDVFIKALNSSFKGDTSLISNEQIAKLVNNYQRELAAKKTEEAHASAEKNKAEGEAFLAENKNKDGVVTTASGLQYKILKKGNGPKPQKSDKVSVHYIGKLIDGREFDSSVKRGQPAKFGVTQVIPGWTEALQMMRVGGKWELYIPSELAYGSQKRSELITPNSTLIFEVELLGIEK